MGLGAIVREPPRLHHLPRRRGGVVRPHSPPTKSEPHSSCLETGVWEVLLFVTVCVCTCVPVHVCACVYTCVHVCADTAYGKKMKMVFNLRKDHQAICGLFLVTFLEQRGIVFPQRYLEQNRLRGD